MAYGLRHRYCPASGDNDQPKRASFALAGDKRGAWVEILTETLEMDIHLPRRKHRSTQGLFEEPRGHGQATRQHARNGAELCQYSNGPFPVPLARLCRSNKCVFIVGIHDARPLSDTRLFQQHVAAFVGGNRL